MRALSFTMLSLVLAACSSDNAVATRDAGKGDGAARDGRAPPADAKGAADARRDGTSVADARPDVPASCTPEGGLPAAVPVPPIHTPRWAFEPWISKDISTGPDTYDFVGGFKQRDIPVGVVVLDSPWETQYNTFLPNPTRYPDFPKIVSDMHAQDVKVVLWVTAMVNSSSFDLEVGGDTYIGPSPNLAEGDACGFFVNGGAEYSWWKGKGASLDFFNPGAVAWWHAQQDTVLEAGLDGWKLDFAENYITNVPLQTAAGSMPLQPYSEQYYRDFLSYGVQQRGSDFATLVRAWDVSYNFAGRFFATPDNAPVCWMGDNRRDWVGIADALDEMMRSAVANYVVLGSDIGGYLDRDDQNLLGPEIPLDPTVFARWTALGGLSPFMQLHGRANITPWTFPEMPDTITAIYRYWAKLHHSMIPFYYSLAEEAYAAHGPMLHPIGTATTWGGDYRFLVGDALLVAPIVDATGVRDVALPAGKTWFDWWAPANDPLPGGQTLAGYDSTDLSQIPLFVASGAIMPLDVTDDVNGVGTAASAGKLTVLVYPDTQATQFLFHEDDDATTTLGAQLTGAGFSVTLSRTRLDTLVRVRAETSPASVSVNGAAVTMLSDRDAFDASTTGWFYETTTRSAWVHVPAAAGTQTVTGG
jgi:alpha-D-xyloside xylohydrolase